MFYRAEHKAGYTVMDNGFLSREKNLSLDARGLLATILSLPDDWQFSERGLCQIVPDGRRRVHGALIELEHAGYIVRGSQGRDQAGRMTAQTWDVFESPQVATDTRNVTAVSTRRNKIKPLVTTDAQNVQTDLTSDNAPFHQVAADVHLPLADTVQQVITKDKELKNKGADSGASKNAPNQLHVCPICGRNDGVTRTESGMLTCSCGYAWTVRS